MPLLVAREYYQSHKEPKTSMLSMNDILSLKYTTRLTRCLGCTNHCLLTIKLSKATAVITYLEPYRAWSWQEKNKENIPNLFDYKYRIFDYEPLEEKDAKRELLN